MFLVVVVTITSPSTQGNESRKEVVQQQVNPATKPEAVHFAQNFVAQYLTWKRGDKEEREKRLQWYLAEGLDSHGGLNMENLTYDSRYLGSTVKKVEEKGRDKAYITLHVSYELSGEVDKKEGKKTNKTEQSSQYVVVPVAYNGTYGVYELPKFTFIDEKTTVKAKELKKDLRQANSEEADNIRNFLDTFFSSYAEDPKDRLGYILEDPDHLNGLNHAMRFVEVRHSEVYEGEEEGQYVVVCGVVFEDPTSTAQFTTSYELVVEQKGKHFVVKSMNE
ncbi:conjugal transfer protein [Kroppenstedtia guangzhouensis]|nr:conjugal transfer protein [Kroppenstedtia guangzhouensis]